MKMINGGDIESLLAKLGVKGEEKVIKSIPAKPEWKKKHKELHALDMELQQKEKLQDALRKNFWSTIELDLNDFRHMRYNHKTDEIEVLEEVENSGIKSPIQLGNL